MSGMVGEPSISSDIPSASAALPCGTVANRATFDDDFDFSRNEFRLDWSSDPLDLGTSFVWLEPSTIENRRIQTREWQVDADWDVNERLTTSVAWRYDMTLDRSAKTELGLEYRTDCVNYDFGFKRSYSEYDQTTPDTSFTFQIDLAGIGSKGNGRSRPTRLGCRG